MRKFMLAACYFWLGAWYWQLGRDTLEETALRRGAVREPAPGGTPGAELASEPAARVIAVSPDGTARIVGELTDEQVFALITGATGALPHGPDRS